MKLFDFLGLTTKRAQRNTDEEVAEALKFAEESSADFMETANTVKDLVDAMVKRQKRRDEARDRLEIMNKKGGA